MVKMVKPAGGLNGQIGKMAKSASQSMRQPSHQSIDGYVDRPTRRFADSPIP